MKHTRLLVSFTSIGISLASVLLFGGSSMAAGLQNVHITTSPAPTTPSNAPTTTSSASLPAFTSTVTKNVIHPNPLQSDESFGQSGEVEYAVPFYQAGSYTISFQMGALWADTYYENTPNSTNTTGPIPLYASNEWNTGFGWTMAGWHGSTTTWLWGNTYETAAAVLYCDGAAGTRSEYGIGTYNIGKAVWDPHYINIVNP